MIRINNGILRALQLCEGSQKEVADKIGTSRAYISGIIHNMSGYCPMSLRKKLLNAFPILCKDDFLYYTEIEGKNLSRDKVMAKLIIKFKDQKSKKRGKKWKLRN
jgi:hypothetical protein